MNRHQYCTESCLCREKTYNFLEGEKKVKETINTALQASLHHLRNLEHSLKILQ